MANRRRVATPGSRSLKWWWRKNRLYIFIIIAIGCVMAFVLNYEIKFFEFREIPNIILNKEHRDILKKQGGLNDEDVAKLKSFYPEIDWEKNTARKRYLRNKELEKTTGGVIGK